MYFEWTYACCDRASIYDTHFGAVRAPLTGENCPYDRVSPDYTDHLCSCLKINLHVQMQNAGGFDGDLSIWLV